MILSDEREPIPKCLLVGPVIEPQEVRRSVLKAVVRVLRFRDCPLLYQTSRQSGRRRVSEAIDGRENARRQYYAAAEANDKLHRSTFFDRQRHRSLAHWGVITPTAPATGLPSSLFEQRLSTGLTTYLGITSLAMGASSECVQRMTSWRERRTFPDDSDECTQGSLARKISAFCSFSVMFETPMSALILRVTQPRCRSRTQRFCGPLDRQRFESG